MDDFLFCKSDVLFRDEVNSSEGSWLQTSSPKLSTYADGYEEIIEHIFEIFKNSSNNNVIVYPVIYVARHFIELKLKELYSLGCHYMNNTKPSFTIDIFKNGHDLAKLWDNYYKDIISKIKEIRNNDIEDVTRILYEFKLEDPSSQTFRYPFSTNKNERALYIRRHTIDMNNFEMIFKKLIIYFRWHTETLYSLIDEPMAE